MHNNRVFKPTVIAVAIGLAFPATAALADEVQELISPNVTEVGASLLNVDKINPLYRQYTGLNSEGVNGSVDLNVVQRSDAGRWFRVEGRDLGLRTQEFKASAEQQGDWSVGIGYNQIPRFAPFTVITPVDGVGSNTLVMPAAFPGATSPVRTIGNEETLMTERKGTTLTARKFISDNLQVNFSFKHEDKQGVRMSGANGASGKGVNGATVSGALGTQIFAPEPIDSTHQQVEASIDYATKQFYLSGSYYGSFFENNAGNALFVTSPNVNNRTAMSPLSLAPDNHAHEFQLAGGYNFSSDTQLKASVGKTLAYQNNSFIPASLIAVEQGAPGSAFRPGVLTKRSDLGGKVETTNAFASFTSRLTRDLSVLASWAYEFRDDKTPEDIYLIDYNHGGAQVTNNPLSQKTQRGKLEASYRLPMGFKLTGGYDYDVRKYDGMDELFRDKTTEGTFRLDLRKSLGETLNGSVTVSHSDRDGSKWGSTPSPRFVNSPAELARVGGSIGEHWTAPTQFSDRERDKVRLLLDWLPTNALSVQFSYEYANDDFSTRVDKIGLNKGKFELFSLDGSYRLSERWKANMWYSHGKNEIEQHSLQSTFGSLCNGSSVRNTCVPWGAQLNLNSDAIGAGFDGQLTSALSVGGQYLYSHDVNEYDISVANLGVRSPLPGATSPVLAGAGILPDTKYQQNTLRLFARYAFNKSTAMRLDYVWDKREFDDFTWQSWRFSDGTRVFQKPEQTTQLIGVTVSHRF
ncbi:MtrB/PioB family decaheme-associated outer membrane protein [Azoarcus sp. DN11]|uniref:MtrB/PioB family decaheme-associated outer membrane protein n=1 Tax=Azoarcus sp. DN11 TaxID=356837 RepID=UPI000EAF2669|nr:MtrB/PioB family decaheme-associated outer membrane protein [Azoarcus sp. DN11]AYH45586.1 hypothetical protein CDA09_19750 [Azoarcus sp. DN11]